MAGCSDEGLPSLEVLLRSLMPRDGELAMHQPKDLLSLAGRLRGQLTGDGRSRGEPKLAEIRSPLRLPLRGVILNFLLPWSIGSPWADNMLAVAATRFLHGGDDGIVKIWCAKSGVLLYSLRSHSNCISDIGLDPSNTVLAVGSIDGYLTFWDLRIGHHLFTINAFSPILTLEFRPVEGASKELVLMTTCSDGYAKFWSINLQQRTWSTIPVKFHCKSLARDEIRCASFSPSGLRFITGATDGIVRLFSVPDVADIKAGVQPSIFLPNVQYLEEHEGYINSVHFSTKGTEFVTSSSDGTVRKWRYDAKWLSDPYDTTAVLGDSTDMIVPGRPRKVTIVTFCNNDETIVAAVNQGFELIVFDAKRQKSPRVLHYHRGEVYILTANPADDRIVLSAGCDGRAALWNMHTGTRIFEFQLENTRFLDGGFSQNGTMFSLVDDLGRVSIFGCGISPDSFSKAPSSQFFHDDWNELIFDSQRTALDAITQRPPHLASREKIFSIERNPYDLIVKESYPLTIPVDIDEGVLMRQQQLYQRQLDTEIDLYNRELQDTVPGSVPRHTRSRRRRVLHGSDVEDEIPPVAEQPAEEGEEEYRLASAGSETDGEVGITSTDHEMPSPGPYNFRRRLHEASPRQGRRSDRLRPIPEFEEEEEPLYRPDRPALRHRGSSRRRPVITESDEDTGPLIERVQQVSKWLSMKDRQVFPYLPQIYDVVAYFPEGHRLFLSREEGVQFHDGLPWETEGRLPPVVFGQIISMNFFPGDPTWCLVELLILRKMEARESLPPPTHIPASAHRIQIAFYDMDNQPDFIIPFCRYHWSVQPVQRYTSGEIVRVVFGRNETYEARVKKVTVPADRIPEKPWQCYFVEWLTLSDDPEPLSPWELETILEEDSPNREPYCCSEYITSEVLRQLDEGLQKLMADPRGAPFKKAVDLHQFPDYLEEVAYPMDLTLLHQRVINGYHRRIEAFEWDARLIYENAFVYNLPDSDIVQDADYILSEILRLVKRAERGTRRISRHVNTTDSTDRSNHGNRANHSNRADSHETPMRHGAAEREARARRRAGLDLPIHRPEQSSHRSEQRSHRSEQSRPKRRRIRSDEEDSDSQLDTDEEVITPRVRTGGRRHSPRSVTETPTSLHLRRSSRYTS
ncbi:Bromodomain and WD repeat-containing protein 1 [Paramicrosporidium saccamoebae]|uniref:Bromodomain and WD repeat-containing protein 1 n=1 Tax=Paramicrosporidium saccamoebae TaxID=1246581 RepID=A0A2H9TGG6_9FUNG|nr:Bromodomain and WD repeat-containing protein 1 [Paramicrosporidium saccamoebae]